MNIDIYIYILLFSCTCARVHFSPVIVQLVKKLEKNMSLTFFFRKVHVPCNTNLQWRIIWLIKSRHTKNIFFFLIFCVVPLNREKSPNWLAINVMASIASGEAYFLFLMECIMRCPEAFLRETVN